MEAYISKSVILRTLIKLITYFNPITLILMSTFGLFLLNYQKKKAKYAKHIDKIPGPIPFPFIGNQFETDIDNAEVLNRFITLTKIWGYRGVGRIWVGSRPMLIVSKASTVEPILSSSKHIDKSVEYDFLHPWLGTGLLTSFGSKWHSRRKILTPAFHFKILDDFIEIFHEQATILVDRIRKEAGKGAFNAFPYVTHCTLDVICETAMGIKVNAQSCSDSDYVRAVYEIGAIVQKRQAKLFLHPDFVFRWTKDYQTHQKCIEILHGVSNGVIRDRKDEILKKKQQGNNNVDQWNNNVASSEQLVIGENTRLAFLDLLIEASKDGAVLSNEDIREEVDTFMFEGHDTTSAAISWCLYLFGSYPEVQEKLHEEMMSIFGDDKARPATMKELNDMKYLDICIKEALRLFPSVPMMARQISDDVEIGGHFVPKGTTATICTYMLHRDPEVFPNPEQYNPDRFLPENCQGRHPFAYIPFSAGPRNCIGQKFAVLEEKVILSSVIRNYIIESCERREDMTLMCELILRPKDGILIKLTERQ